MNIGALSLQLRCLSCWSAGITRPHRLTYARTYPTLLVQPDGSTYTIRYPEPRRIIKLPLNIWTLTEAQRKERLEKRKPKKKVVIDDDLDDDFNSAKYLKYIKKK
ncbi:39S ribosomal protein L55, mitochondrial [Anthonomus grandis grandis]|uniref:39S ribosomal protein L55, mitochondrial n=1 Tax=Anthonomus grandis grandis TaxID=2921223 RepID=UPI0021668267|nr:39S ribosomal protein L55, mitochondrial [Anthonomus grandis grandis]